jgi:hypothetical protein
VNVDNGMGEVVSARERHAHGPWSDLALHTIGWRAFHDLCSQVCEVMLSRPVEIFREAQDGGQDAVFLIPSGSDAPSIGTIQCKHTSEPIQPEVNFICLFWFNRFNRLITFHILSSWHVCLYLISVILVIYVKLK